MFCVHCGKKLPDSARFCSACGKSVLLEAASVFETEAAGLPSLPTDTPLPHGGASPVSSSGCTTVCWVCNGTNTIRQNKSDLSGYCTTCGSHFVKTSGKWEIAPLGLSMRIHCPLCGIEYWDRNPPMHSSGSFSVCIHVPDGPGEGLESLWQCPQCRGAFRFREGKYVPVKHFYCPRCERTAAVDPCRVRCPECGYGPFDPLGSRTGGG